MGLDPEATALPLSPGAQDAAPAPPAPPPAPTAAASKQPRKAQRGCCSRASRLHDVTRQQSTARRGHRTGLRRTWASNLARLGESGGTQFMGELSPQEALGKACGSLQLPQCRMAPRRPGGRKTQPAERGTAHSLPGLLDLKPRQGLRVAPSSSGRCLSLRVLREGSGCPVSILSGS